MSRRDGLSDGARVLVIRLSALGDVLFGMETVASLKRERPDVRVDFLVEDRHGAILAGAPDLDAVRTVPRRGVRAKIAAVRALRVHRYDVVLDLHGLLKSAVLVRAVRGLRKLGFTAGGAREGAHLAYEERIALPDPLPHRAERGLHLLRALGLSGQPAHPRLHLDPRPHPAFVDVDRPRVVLHPGASSFAAFKRWPAAKFRALASELDRAGVRVAISFGPGEESLAQEVAQDLSDAILLDGRRLGLLGLAAAYRDADLMIAADTGPLHVAAASGTRVVALFGPKDVALYGPRWHADHRVLYHDVPCRPCKRRTCASPQCVLGIEVREVVDAALDCLALARSSR